MLTEKIKQFYSDLHFPGRYTWEDIQFYDDEGIHNIYLKEIDSIMKNGVDILDVGCGTGLLSNLFASRYNSQFTSVDFSDSIDYARLFAKEHNINNVNWVKTDFLTFETDKKYDIIICCGVLHHMPDYEKALAKIKSLLKPGGTLVLAIYNKYGKILKQYFKINYNSDILYKDQELNPFELSFTNRQIHDMCNDLIFNAVTPSISNRFVDALSWFNNSNGGLVLYIFKNKV